MTFIILRTRNNSVYYQVGRIHSIASNSSTFTSTSKFTLAQGLQIDAFSRVEDWEIQGLRKLCCLHLGVFVLLRQTLCKKQRINFSWSIDLGFGLLGHRIQRQYCEFHCSSAIHPLASLYVKRTHIQFTHISHFPMSYYPSSCSSSLEPAR